MSDTEQVPSLTRSSSAVDLTYALTNDAEPGIEGVKQVIELVREVAFIMWSLLIETASGGQNKSFALPLTLPKKCFAPP